MSVGWFSVTLLPSASTHAVREGKWRSAWHNFPGKLFVAFVGKHGDSACQLARNVWSLTDRGIAASQPPHLHCIVMNIIENTQHFIFQFHYNRFFIQGGWMSKETWDYDITQWWIDNKHISKLYYFYWLFVTFVKHLLTFWQKSKKQTLLQIKGKIICKLAAEEWQTSEASW